MPRLVSMEINGETYEMRPSKKNAILELLAGTTIVPDGMKPRTETDTAHKPIEQPKAPEKRVPNKEIDKPLTPAQKAAPTRAKNKAKKEAEKKADK